MPYLAKVFLIFDAIFSFLAILYWLYFKKSGEKFYFYFSIGFLLTAIYGLIVIFNPDLNFKNADGSIFFIISIFPGFILSSAGFVWGNIRHPGLVKFISLKSIKQAQNVKYRKDLLISAIIGYVTAVCFVLITKTFNLAPTTLILLSAAFAFFSPLDIATNVLKE